jgi:hypothetical protein
MRRLFSVVEAVLVMVLVVGAVLDVATVLAVKESSKTTAERQLMLPFLYILTAFLCYKGSWLSTQAT